MKLSELGVTLNVDTSGYDAAMKDLKRYLLNCAYCGGEAMESPVDWDGKIMRRVYCVKCGASSPNRETEELAGNDWNRLHARSFARFAKGKDKTMLNLVNVILNMIDELGKGKGASSVAFPIVQHLQGEQLQGFIFGLQTVMAEINRLDPNWRKSRT